MHMYTYLPYPALGRRTFRGQDIHDSAHPHTHLESRLRRDGGVGRGDVEELMPAPAPLARARGGVYCT